MDGVETKDEGGLADEDGADVVHDTNRRDCDAIDELEGVHGNDQLGDDDEDVAQGDDGALDVGGVEGGRGAGDPQKGIDADDEGEDLDGPGDMVVDQSTSVGDIQISIDISVEAWKENGFEQVMLDQKTDDEDDGKDQGRVGDELGDDPDRKMCDVIQRMATGRVMEVQHPQPDQTGS